MEAILPAIELLWVDLRTGDHSTGFIDTLHPSVNVHRLTTSAGIEQAIQVRPPHLICFDFDYPTLQGLEQLKSTKLKYSSVPILMLTEQRSEELVIWALRTRVWDYFVKPVNKQDFCRRLHALSGLVDPARSRGGAFPGRTLHMPQQTVPIQVETLGLGCGKSGTSAAVAYINDNYGEKIPLGEMARLCGMGPYQFSRAFKRDHGVTFREFLIRYRITKALELFQKSDTSIIEIVFAVGFNDPSHFSRTFRQYVGVTPSVYRTTLGSKNTSGKSVDATARA